MACNEFHHNRNIFSNWKEMVKRPEETADFEKLSNDRRPGLICCRSFH